MEKAETQELPVYFFRYEDMLANPKETLEGIFAFLLEEKSVAGMLIEKRI